VNAAARYGILFGVVWSALWFWDNPAAWAIHWTFQTIELAIYTILTWRRTGLLWAVIGGAHVAFISAACLGASLAGFTMRRLPPTWLSVFLVNCGVVVLLEFWSRRTHARQYEHWKRHMEPMSLGDLLMFRHIPHLR
jgi:hypothetical protein